MPRSSTSVMKASRSAARERAMRGSRSAAAVVAGVAAGATTAEAAGVGVAAGVGTAAVGAAGLAAGAGAATAVPVAESEAGIGAAASSAACASCALVAVFDAVKCPPPLGSIIWSIKQVDYYSTHCSIVHYTARKHARQQTMEGLLSI